MSDFQRTFDPAIWEAVRNIPAGNVKSYGNIARIAGYPKHSRMVSKAMCRSPKPLPWHRVVRSDLTLAFPEGSDAYEKQAQLLEMEGVEIIHGKVKPLRSDNDMSLDELLWGTPPE